MRCLIIHAALVLLYWTQTPTLAGPHEEGMAAGTAANPVIRNDVNPSGAAAVLPGYTATPPERAYYSQPTLSGQADARLAHCAQTTDDPACEAQRGALHSAQTPRETIPASDPAVAAAREVERHPASALGNLATAFSGCAGSGDGCKTNFFCIGESCFNTGYASDTDFARAMTYMEAAREAGMYLDHEHMQVFRGEQSRCRNRLLRNCCTSAAAGAGMHNRALFGMGSRLVYDVLMNADNRQFLYQGVNALLSGAGFNGSFTSYGVTVAVNGTALPAGSVTVFAGDNVAIAFNPWSLSVTAIMYVITSGMSCNEEEGKLALKEGAHLCHAVGTYCSSCLRVLGKCVSCITRSTSKCCFNSMLARLVNEQGRRQVGKAWGSAENPDCSGFSVAQLQSLDFAQMDLTEFYASIVPTMPDVRQIQLANIARFDGATTNPLPARPPDPAPPETKPESRVPPATGSGPGPTPPPTNGNVAPFGQDPAHYTSTFSEEFGSGLDSGLWNDAIFYQGSNATKNYAVDNGVLKIWPQRDGSGNFFDRTIDTDGKYYQTYGYFEMEAKLPYGRGTWPAFWLLNHDAPDPYRPEIDILEAYAGGGPDSGWSDGNLRPTAYASTVWPQGIKGGPAAGSKAFQNLGDLSAGFHKYGAKWEPNRISFYFDGKEMYSVDVSMPNRMYIMLDLWFGSASGAADDSTPQGQSNAFEVNYVRAWSLK
jgi:hypothetical protein